MLDGYSAEARRAVSLATAEARRLAHPHIGTEHLLLGLLAGETTATAQALHDCGAGLAAARHKVIEAAGADAGWPPPVDLPFTPRAQRALERAGRFSRQDREPQVHTRHVLLGVLDVEGLACQVLRGLGVDLTRLRDGVVPAPPAATVPTPAPSAPQQADPLAPPASASPRCPACAGDLAGHLVQSELPTVAAGGGATAVVRVISCAGCGTALGVLPPTG